MTHSSSESEKPEVALVGAGAVGSALARRLAERSYPVSAVLSRTRADAEALARQVGADVASNHLADLPPTARLVFLCVPDDAIRPVARELSALSHAWRASLVAHTSGVHPAAALDALAPKGATLLSFHPLQTFPPEADAAAFDGIYVGLEGGDDGVTAGRQIAEAIGAHPVEIPSGAKARYHLAASVAANGLVALMGVVEEILTSANGHPEEATALVRPLVERTWRNLVETSPESAITGPIARGDEGTVRAHADALATHLPHLQPVYAALATELVRIAVRGGHLDAETAESVLDTLHEGLQKTDGWSH